MQGPQACGKGRASSPATVREEFRLGHRPWLDGLRGIAVLMVLANHLGLLRGGSMGVDVFFVLSGFLITTLLVDERRRTGSISLKKFYLRRVLRLWPALFTLIAVHVAVTWVWRREHLEEVLRESALTACHVANYPTIHKTPMAWIGHTWSLSLEEQFYLLWPSLLCFLLMRGVSPRGLITIVAVGVVASAGWRAALFNGQRWMGVDYATVHSRLYNGLDTRADSLLVGCGVGLLAAYGLLARLPGIARWSGAAAAGSAVGLAYLATYSSEYLPIYWQGLLTVLALMVAAIIVRMLIAPPRLALTVLEFRPLVGIGKISYGLYLYHTLTNTWLALWLGRGYGAKEPGLCALAFGLSVAAAIASYYLIERPFLRLKDRVGRVEKRAVASEDSVPMKRAA